jgi:hypothetical protein
MSQLAPPPTTSPQPATLPEGRIREAWPSITAVNPMFGGLGMKLVQTYFLAPIGWLLLLPAFLQKFAPWICARYTLTNKRLMIQRGWMPSPTQEVKLEDITGVRLDEKSIDPFLVIGTLEILGKNGEVVMTMTGVPEPNGFKEAVLNAVRAYGRPANVLMGLFKSAAEAK